LASIVTVARSQELTLRDKIGFASMSYAWIVGLGMSRERPSVAARLGQ
jgi:hypothetical protein